MNVLKINGIIELTHGDLDRLSKGEEIGVDLNNNGQCLVLRVPVRRRNEGERGAANTFGGPRPHDTIDPFNNQVNFVDPLNPRPRPTTLNEVDDQRDILAEGQRALPSARQQAIEQADRAAKEFERKRL